MIAEFFLSMFILWLAGIACDPSQGACCSKTCGFRPTTVICASEGECTATSNCSGSSAVCPEADFKDDNTPCNQNTQVCKEGVSCTLICLMKPHYEYM